MDGGDSLSLMLVCIFEGIVGDSGGCFSSDELDCLCQSWDDAEFDSRIFSFGVLSNDHQIDIIVQCLESRDGDGWSDIGVQIELLSQRQIEGCVSLSDGSRQGTFQGDEVPLDGFDDLLRYTSLWGYDNSFPLDGDTGLPISVIQR